jgi:hypothetical protein
MFLFVCLDLLEFHDSMFIDKLFDIKFNEKGFLVFVVVVRRFVMTTAKTTHESQPNQVAKTTKSIRSKKSTD